MFRNTIFASFSLLQKRILPLFSLFKKRMLPISRIGAQRYSKKGNSSRQGLVPCYAYRVPVGTPCRLSCCYHGTAPRACTVLCISRPCRDALPAIILLSCPVPIGTRPCITRYKRTKSSQCRDKTTNRPASRQGRDTKRTIECVMALQSFFGLSVRSAYPVG